MLYFLIVSLLFLLLKHFIFILNKNSSMDLIRTGHLWKLNDNKKTWDKYWFSLNNSNLVYWNEKIEQDLSKQPLNKIELFKCVQIKELFNNTDYENYSFQLNFHNSCGSIVFKAITNDVRNNWIQALKQSIEQSVSLINIIRFNNC